MRSRAVRALVSAAHREQPVHRGGEPGSQLDEPLLKLNWTDGAKRNMFLARFGDTAALKNSYVTLDELCGPTKSVF